MQVAFSYLKASPLPFTGYGRSAMAIPGWPAPNLGGAGIAVELWELPAEGILQLLSGEPEGQCLGKVALADGQVVLGILAEAWILENCPEITRFGGWQNYLQSK